MKKYFLLLLLSLFIFSCEEKTDEITAKESSSELHAYINNWIYANMKYHYYWNDKIPSKPNISLNHSKFFNLLLYRGADGDRFSWIQNNYKELISMLSGVSYSDFGFKYIPIKEKENEDNVIFLVVYAKKGSEAEEKGLKRGDFIFAIDEKTINIQNYNSLLSEKNSAKFSVLEKGDIVINATEIKENPIFLSTVLKPEGSDRKIAYLVYNFFSPDSGDKSSAYDLQLIQEFKSFQTEGVNEFILDLRYNSGGSVSSCLLLSSLLRKDRKKTDVFAYLKTNKKINEQKKYQFIEEYQKISLPKLENVDRVFVLTGRRTASASEMVINGLRPYMTTIQIGQATIGKNVGSYTIYDENNKNNTWGMQPITFKIFNADKESDYTDGFVPESDSLIDEIKNPIVDFGDMKDPLLRRSLTIMGISFPAEDAASLTRQKKKKEKTRMGLGAPIYKKHTKENWQESEMDYPMYIKEEL